MQQVVIATHNQGKMEEFKVLLEALGLDFCCLNDFPDIPEPEETGKTFAANARLKATYYSKATGPVSVLPGMQATRPRTRKTTNSSLLT